LRGAGLRRGESVKLMLSDFHSGSVKVRSGKGGKDRTVYLPDGVLPIIEDWLEIRGRESGALICHINKSGAVTLRQLTPQELAGHATPELTSRYDRRGEEVQQRAVQAISVPKRR